jgi:hypothetical protein
MPKNSVYTIEEASQSLQVPIEAIYQEIKAGRLKAFTVAGGYDRILESDFESFLQTATEAAPHGNGSRSNSLGLQPTVDFAHTWPAYAGQKKITEEYTNALEGVVPYQGKNYRVKLGFTSRTLAGKRRTKVLVLVDGYPTVEFCGADASMKGKLASVIKDRDGKQLPARAAIPPEFQGMPVGAYADVVVGPMASKAAAIVCDSKDAATMAKYALIRYSFREARRIKKARA